MPKRPRTTVPDPPKSLLELLQRDRQVYEYFTCLQASLEQDVDVWKKRALKYQEQLQLQERQSAPKPPMSASKKYKIVAKPPLIIKPTTAPEKPLLEPEGTLELLSADSNDESDDAFLDSFLPAVESQQEEQEMDYQNQMIAKFLKQSAQGLENLDVELIKKSESFDNDDDDDSAHENIITEKEALTGGDGVSNDLITYTRNQHSTEQHFVATSAKEFAESIRKSIKTLAQADEPFLANFAPATNEGVRLLFRSLIVLDSYCSASSAVHLGQLLSTDEGLLVGVQGRKEIVARLMQSFSAEITHQWAVRDRSERFSNVDVHYYAHRDAATEETFGGKTSSQLCCVLERSLIAQIVVGFYLSRDDIERATQVVLGYLASTIPSRDENYPKLPPVLSILTLEGLLRPKLKWRMPDVENESCWLLLNFQQEQAEDANEIAGEFCRIFSLCAYKSAIIWKERSTSCNSRIRDVALVEVASYERLLRSEVCWIVGFEGKTMKELSHITQEQALFKYIANDRDLDLVSFDRCICLQLALILQGNLSIALTFLDNALVDGNIPRIRAAATACRYLLIRLGDEARSLVGKRDESSIALPNLVESLDAFFESWTCPKRILGLAASGLDCFRLLGDGDATVRIIERVMLCSDLDRTKLVKEEPDCMKNFMEVIKLVAQSPAIRVINLKRRHDRMKSFLIQALRERLVVFQAVAELNHVEIEKFGYYHGRHAFDGSGRMAEARKRLVEDVGGHSKFNSLVNVIWCPNDLKPFDRDAPNDEGLTRMTESEIACALSHIASWKGVYRSLRIVEAERSEVLNNVFRHPCHLRRSFRIAGFARGPALDQKNAGMAPAPVGLVLEDDAILVERFQEKLEALLNDLPRDFHMCSLGYSRPKSAPIVPYNAQCGVPSHLFYLTGYLISGLGCEHLLASLPVVGPVDSFIGLKMTSNWDNSFGVAMGVGIHARPNSELPAKADLCQIMKFRAFCALRPLCSQQVGTLNARDGVTPSTTRSWRQRDTDIQFSGDLTARGPSVHPKEFQR